MAYRPAEERYNMRYGPAMQQHHNRYQAPPPTSTSYHPRPSRGGRPGRTTSYLFPEPRGPHLYGSSFPTREQSLLPPRHIFAGGGGRGPGNDGGNWSGDQYHREHSILPTLCISFFLSIPFSPCVCVCVCECMCT